jgi:hypothetical protein
VLEWLRSGRTGEEDEDTDEGEPEAPAEEGPAEAEDDTPEAGGGRRVPVVVRPAPEEAPTRRVQVVVRPGPEEPTRRVTVVVRPSSPVPEFVPETGPGEEEGPAKNGPEENEPAEEDQGPQTFPTWEEATGERPKPVRRKMRKDFVTPNTPFGEVPRRVWRLVRDRDGGVAHLLVQVDGGEFVHMVTSESLGIRFARGFAHGYELSLAAAAAKKK